MTNSQAPDPRVATALDRRHAAIVAATLIGPLALPTLVCYFWICLQYYDGLLVFPSGRILAQIPAPTLTAAAIFVGWLLFQAALQVSAPGKWVAGQPLANGSRLRYRINGWASWWCSVAVLAGLVGLSWVRPTILAEQFGPLITTGTIFTYLIAGCLYWHGRRQAGAERNGIYDFWNGTALNPRIGNFDLKLFCEARPGLIGWVALDLSLAAKQHQDYGHVTVPMILICAFQVWYVADYFWHEEAILSTWDIKHEKFGWMLCWGDLVWVPFTYSIQAYYLVGRPEQPPGWALVSFVLLNAAGYVVFRGANLQKHRFRKDPSAIVWGKQAKFLATKTGHSLLASGWWGLVRHPNYLGDLLMGLAWCLLCGFRSPLPYFYIVFLTVLLVHRERRDDALCSARYGAVWDAYRARVPRRIVPGVY
ncbi:DUF1295 domain-containing protein [Streptomyces sp. NPDC020681]|uniref:DUF1295 domain-containing protein n=1 Tax=Streptomyces sp. NPDC020681 TaxID=3365083 RepID=UPI0037B000CF